MLKKILTNLTKNTISRTTKSAFATSGATSGNRYSSFEDRSEPSSLEKEKESNLFAKTVGSFLNFGKSQDTQGSTSSSTTKRPKKNEKEKKDPFPHGRLKEKVAIVTGGASGIGEAIVVRYVREGACVAIIDVDPAGEQLAKQLNEEAGQERAIFIKADVSKENEVKSLVDETVKKWGTVDILVNNAAVFVFKSFDASVEEWTKAFNVNVLGTALCTRYASDVMKQQKKGGSIINMSSVSAFEGDSNFAVYAMTKGAMMQMARDFAADLGPYDIRVNAICPGTIITPACLRYLKGLGVTEEEFRKAHGAKTYFGRVGKPDDVSGAAVFLASDDSTFVTGSPIFVDGGRENKT